MRDFNSRITAAISDAVGAVMADYAQERSGLALPELEWSLFPQSGRLSGFPAAHDDPEIEAVLAGWAQALGLTQLDTAPGMAGSVTYAGQIEDRPVQVWGVVDRDVWENRS